jgi:hypothetical protein
MCVGLANTQREHCQDEGRIREAYAALTDYSTRPRAVAQSIQSLRQAMLAALAARQVPCSQGDGCFIQTDLSAAEL